MADTDPTRLNYLIHHTFLPPKLPQQDDNDHLKDKLLLTHCSSALKYFQDLLPQHERPIWTPCVKMVDKLVNLRGDSASFPTKQLGRELASLSDKDVLTLHLRGQNAGLIVRRVREEYYFESFELSPTNEAVMNTAGRLHRSFPGPAIAVAAHRVKDASFYEPLSEFLVRMDLETPSEVQPIFEKSNSRVNEIRDTVDPRLITEMFTGILRAVGRPVDVPRIQKNTREEVLWSDALCPWRRSPLWLLLRVALQTTLVRYDPKLANVRYKSFILYFLARIIRDALNSTSSHLLFSMCAKLSRRALKLEHLGAFHGMEFVRGTIVKVHQKLQSKWNSLQVCEKTIELKGISFLHDTRLTIPGLKSYLKKMTSRPIVTRTTHGFNPACSTRLLEGSKKLPKFEHSWSEDIDRRSLELADLEKWVANYLSDWTRVQLGNPNACTNLANLIESYAELARLCYSGNPEETSIMLLTILELWIALDKCSVDQISLLHDFDPGFPEALFDPLLLPKKDHLKRLVLAEKYLANRRTRATSKSSYAFDEFASSESLGVRYFNQSAKHQELRARIEADAATEKYRKFSEYAAKRRQYQDLIRDASSQFCQYEKSYNYLGREESTHSGSCFKCSLERDAANIDIAIHEHPLPTGDLNVKAAVFELDIPDVIYTWRDATFRVLVDVFSTQEHEQEDGCDKLYFLQSYHGLQKYFVSKVGRIRMASVAKPWVVTHHRSKKISQISEDGVCVNNGLKYNIYDFKAENWTRNLTNKCGVLEICTFLLPDAYRNLQYAVQGTTHTSNEVIAGQDACPQDLTIHEFYAFASFRAGHRLQWRNIARELRSRTLNFSREETLMLVAQSIWQAGPLGNDALYRESHVDLAEEDFALSLISSIDDALGTIEGSWQGASAARIFIFLTTRLLSCSPCDNVRAHCLTVLSRARKITLGWTRNLKKRLQSETGDEELGKLNERILETALTCHGTFDVDEQDLPKLWSSKGSVEAITECSIITHDHCPVGQKRLPVSIRTLLRRFRRISHAVERSLRVHILNTQHNHDGLKSTIRLLWAAYRPSTQWEALDQPCERWLKSEASSHSEDTVLVHYNILDGTLLLNGCPLARLPRQYEAHDTYKRLLENIHFGFCGSELIIRARNESKIYELIPLTALEQDFPYVFAHEYVHWLDVQNGTVEWRSIKDPWKPSLQNWRMDFRTDRSAVLKRGSFRAVDIRTRSAESIASALHTLEIATYIHIAWDLDTEEARIHLPRLKLDFVVRRGSLRLESKQFRGMFVDGNQALGTMEGLKAKLILRGLRDSSRGVIIPYGSISLENCDDHVCVRIENPPTYKQIPYHYFQIDSQLGRLVDSGSLTSKLYKSYLHAVTSHCLTDSLTGRTGTEEAIWTLRESASSSFIKLYQVDMDLLLLIARLTPRRRYYPKYLRVMQQVEWNQHLSPLSQHEVFCKIAEAILSKAKDLEMFQNQSSRLPDVDITGDQHLLLRATIRNSTYYVHDFGAENFTVDRDQDYKARDAISGSSREYETCSTASLVDTWSPNLASKPNLLAEFESWKTPLERGPIFHLGYDKTWLEPPSTYLPKYWIAIQGAFLQSTQMLDKYRIMFLVCTMAYAACADQLLVQTLLAFATVPELRALTVPDFPSFRLSFGYQPQKTSLTTSIAKFTKQFESCPEKSLPLLLNETTKSANTRRRTIFSRMLTTSIDTLATGLISQ
ncbi:MAG: hypothetical protein MMC33_003696 [Icmadophila ericetorum]|nr:hypothetical protein [Icmadophila ericetorum]